MELILKLEGKRPWVDEEFTTACKIKLEEGITKEEFLYKLQDMFVAVYEQESAIIEEKKN